MQQKKPASAKNFEKFVSKCREVFGDRFTYFPEEFYKLRDETKILDTVTGKVFYQNAGNHQSGSLPRELRSLEPSEKQKAAIKWNDETIIKQIPEWHPTLSDVVVEESKGVFSIVSFFCSIHGERFQRSFRDMNEDSGCPACGRDTFKTPFSEIAAKLEEICPQASIKEEDYRGMRSFMKAIDEDYGEYQVLPASFMYPRSGVEGLHPERAEKLKVKKRSDAFFDKMAKLHPNLDFSLSEYVDSKTEVTFRCPKHGVQTSMPEYLGKGKGCLPCSYDARASERRLTQPEALERLEALPNPYNCTFDKVEYKGMVYPITITCPTHGDFEVLYQTVTVCSKKVVCPKCAGSLRSGTEDVIIQHIVANTDLTQEDIVTSYRADWVSEIDIYIPKLKFGIEYNGTAFHNSTIGLDEDGDFFGRRSVPIDYHAEKFLTCALNQVKLVHIFEIDDLDEWLDKIVSYIKEPYRYNILFTNEHRIDRNLDLYGKSDIVPDDQCVPTLREIMNQIKEQKESIPQIHHRAKWTPNAILEQLSKWNSNCSYKVLKAAGLLSSVEITCPLHGTSERTFRAMSAKSTCPTCSRSKGNTLNWEEVKARLQEKHPDCDFSQSEYKGMREPIKIILPDGREVFRVPNDFLRRSTNYSIIR